MRTTAAAVRQLSLSRQLLAGQRPPPTKQGIEEVVRRLGRLQLDPTAAVAPSHLLVLWSRLGRFEPADVDHVTWTEHRLFEYNATLRPIEQVPLVSAFAPFWTANEGATRAAKIASWIAENRELERHILEELARRGPLSSDQFEDRSRTPWRSGGYFDGHNVGRMLEFLAGVCRIAVAGRRGRTRLWDLVDRVWPERLMRVELDSRDLLRQRLANTLRALGVVSGRELRRRVALPGSRIPYEQLIAEGRVRPVVVSEDGIPWRDDWYVHPDDAEALVADERPQPVTTLLSPFDNVIHDRDRTRRLFQFVYRTEIYIPPAKRRHGYFAMPILHGEQLLGTIDPRHDRKSGTLDVNSIHLAPEAAKDPEVGRAIIAVLDDLAAFAGARAVRYPASVPADWRSLLPGGQLMGELPLGPPKTSPAIM
jgi:uncharacterized protein